LGRHYVRSIKTLFMKREEKHASIELEKMVRHVAGYQRIGGLWG
jgi:hypothetical protein